MSPRKLTTLAGLVWVLGFALSAAGAQTVVYVDDDAPLGGDGTSWETAHKCGLSKRDAEDIGVIWYPAVGLKRPLATANEEAVTDSRHNPDPPAARECVVRKEVVILSGTCYSGLKAQG